MKRVFIIHGWGGNPDEPALVWLAKELEKSELKVVRPAMPNSEEPDINAWVSHLAELVGSPDAETYFIGHSIGCQTIIRYLEKVDTPVGGAVFIAPWLTLKPECLETEQDRAIAKPWLETPIDFEKVKTVTNDVFAIFSDDDEFVPVENAEMFEKKLNARTVIESGKGHFSVDNNVTEIPEVIPEILNMTNNKI